jgi:transcriptional regulator with XRE-family HTH domain
VTTLLVLNKWRKIPFKSTWSKVMNKFGDRLRDLRKAKGWSQEKLARESGVSTSLVSRIEQQAEEYDPTWSTVRAFAKALEVDYRVFDPDTDEEPAQDEKPAPKKGKK